VTCNNAYTFLQLYEENITGGIHRGTNRIPNMKRCLKPEFDSLYLAFSSVCKHVDPRRQSMVKCLILRCLIRNSVDREREK
jgi:hypothetical protein